nr:MAG TPA: hypothetical protein [Caudoviricetes sp.]
MHVLTSPDTGAAAGWPPAEITQLVVDDSPFSCVAKVGRAFDSPAVHEGRQRRPSRFSQ